MAVSVLIGLLHLVTQYTEERRKRVEKESERNTWFSGVCMYVFKNEYRDERVFFSSTDKLILLK